MVFLLGYLYFFLAETFTVRYAAASEDFHVSEFVWTGPYSPFTWYILASLVVPSIVLLIPRLRTYRMVAAMAAIVLPAMWVKRVLIVLPGLLNQVRLPTVQTSAAFYAPTYVELLLTAGSFAGLALILLLFTKLFPPFPVWEIFGHPRTKTTPVSRISLRAVFTGWLSGISVSSAYVFAWAVATVALGEKAATAFSVKLMPTYIQVLATPGLATSSMLNLLSVVVLAGVLALLFVGKEKTEKSPRPLGGN